MVIQALFVGRIYDIVRHVRAGNLETARNLVSNSPGVDWAAQLGTEEYAALFTAPSALAVAVEVVSVLPPPTPRAGPAPRPAGQTHALPELQLGMELFV